MEQYAKYVLGVSDWEKRLAADDSLRVGVFCIQGLLVCLVPL